MNRVMKARINKLVVKSVSRTTSLPPLTFYPTKLTCRNSTAYERRTKDKGQDGGLVS